MSFESFEAQKIIPDAEQAEVWENIRKHFEIALSVETESPVYDDEKQERLREILHAIDENDYSKAFEFFESELSQLKALYEGMLENELAKKVGTPELLAEEIKTLENLKNSLLLEEK